MIAPPRYLNIYSITANHFRNYEKLSLQFEPRPIVITGQNGSGKTNILEAISLLSPGRGLRSANMQDLSNKNTEKEWWLKNCINSIYGNTEVVFQESANTKRNVIINNQNAKSKNELAEIFCVMWLTPQMDHIFINGGTEKRRFFDRLVYNFDAAHAARVTKYEYYVRERNKVLKDRYNDPTWLDVIEKNISEIGIAVIEARLKAAAHLNNIIAKSETKFPKATVKINGEIESSLELNNLTDVTEYYKLQLKSARQTDAIQGRTNIGAHKSDITIFHQEKKQFAEFCSTGEQKALLISLILADAKARIEITNTIPILLLDEIAAHLDEKRKIALFNELEIINCQYFITGINENDFEFLRNKAQFISTTEL